MLDPHRLARRDAGHRPQGTPAPRRAAAVHRPRRPPVHLLRHQHPRPGSSLTWNCGTAAGPAARTGSAAPRTPACATCRCTATTRTRSGARSSPWPANSSPGPRCSPCTARPAAGNPNAAAAALLRRRPAGPRRPPPAAPPGSPMALDQQTSPPPSPGCTPWHPADQPAPPQRQRKEQRGTAEPRPPGATAGPPAHDQPLKTATQPRLQPLTQDHERSRLGRDDRRGRFRLGRGNLTKLSHGGPVLLALIGSGGRNAACAHRRSHTGGDI